MFVGNIYRLDYLQIHISFEIKIKQIMFKSKSTFLSEEKI